MSRKQSIAAGIVGVLVFILFIIGIFSSGSTPNPDASAAKVLTFFHAHRNSQIVSAALLSAAGFLFVFFAGGIWTRMKQADRPIPMLQMAFAIGVAVFAAGVTAESALTFAIADIVNKTTALPATLQTLNVMNAYFVVPLVGGVALMGISVGLYGITANAVHKGYAWPVLIIGIATLTPIGFVAALAFMVWVLAFAIFLLVNGGKEPVAAGAREPIPAPAV